MQYLCTDPKNALKENKNIRHFLCIINGIPKNAKKCQKKILRYN